VFVQIQVFWDLIPCHWINSFQRFEQICSFQLNKSGGQRRTLLLKAGMAFIFRDIGVREEFPLHRNITVLIINSRLVREECDVFLQNIRTGFTSQKTLSLSSATLGTSNLTGNIAIFKQRESKSTALAV
jgi:hypothetical protein